MSQNLLSDKQQKLNLMVGGFILAGLLALAFFALKVSQFHHPMQQSYEVTARFENIGTLKSGASVKSAGVVVGRVKNILFNDQIYQAVLTLELDGQYKFPADSQFKIMTTGLLGDQFIGIEAGAETESLKAGQAVENTQSAMVLEDLIGKFLYSKAQDAGVEKPGLNYNYNYNSNSDPDPATNTNSKTKK